ncbi:Calcium-dependent protein kinase 2 [Striga hermonthica]|uniref:non-specific serine/threonine protein kinase n=1 Tax=Striga hermonthica TaxID=68872 RepID=A0A9N7R8T1_STRHE|nr:Calcium-dependent protein kinase 2 [Striga hermonthica]
MGNNCPNWKKPEDGFFDTMAYANKAKSRVAPTGFHHNPPQTMEIKSRDTKQLQPAIKPKNPTNAKKLMSAGLRAESILDSKTGGYFKEHYTLGDELGRGQYGKTFLCTQKKTGKKFACKSIAKRRLVTEEDVRGVRREIEIMRHLAGNRDIVSIVGAYEDAVAVHVVMELCRGGELFERIFERDFYSEEKAAGLTRKIVGVIERCHSLGVMHRDLKPENFLFVDEDEDSDVKLIDFGLSVFFKPGIKFSEVVGSPHYIAPEVLCDHYGPEADIWSAGVIVYILLCGVLPFWGESDQEIFRKVLNGNIDFSSDPWPNISECAKDLVKKMLVRNPKRRITAQQILRHPWLQTYGLAPDKPLESGGLSRSTRFSDTKMLEKMAPRAHVDNSSMIDCVEYIAGTMNPNKIDEDNSLCKTEQ